MNWINDWIVPPQCNVHPLAYILTAVVAMLFTAVSKGGFGGGAGVVSVPLMLMVAPSLQFVVGMWLPFLVVCDFATVRHYPKAWSPVAVHKLVPGIILGITAATVLLRVLNVGEGSPQMKTLEAWLKLSVALIAVIFLLVQMRPVPTQIGKAAWTPNWRVSLPAGLAAGVTSTLAHAAGPVVTMYLLSQQLDKRVFAGTSGRLFFGINSLKVVYMVAIGVISLHTLRYGVWLMLIAPLGVWLGTWMNRRMSALWFLRIVHVSLAAAAAKLAYDVIKQRG